MLDISGIALESHSKDGFNYFIHKHHVNQAINSIKTINQNIMVYANPAAIFGMLRRGMDKPAFLVYGHIGHQTLRQSYSSITGRDQQKVHVSAYTLGPYYNVDINIVFEFYDVYCYC